VTAASLTALFALRDLYARAWLPAGCWVRVLKYSQNVIGGPLQADLEIHGPRASLEALLDWCRYGVLLISDLGDPVWWGYIARVELPGILTISADVELMANKVAVAYTEVSVGAATTGARGTTDWVFDPLSIKAFGTKELLLSLSGTTAAAAAARAAWKLRQVSYPGGGVQIVDSAETGVAKVTCYGWWKTLAWRYAPVPALLALAFETIGTVERHVGDNSTTKIAQAFDVASVVHLQQISVYVQTVGSPTDNLKVSVCVNPTDANHDKVPGAELASATLAAASVPPSYAWVDLVLSSPYTLAAGSSYFLVVSRSGAQDAANYYSLTLDGAQGYGAGPCLAYGASTWSGVAADLPFRLYDNVLVETTQQIKSLIANYGQFLRVVNTVASGISTESYRSGDTDARAEVEALLSTGNTLGARLLARVDADRNVWISAEPDNQAFYVLDRDGHLYDGQSRVRDELCPVGHWVRARDILAPTINIARLSWIDLFFIEEAEYDVQAKKLTFRPSTEQNPFDLGVQDG
jgi:hypothetical protein